MKVALQKMFGCTRQTVSATLKYEAISSHRNVKIRKAAMEMGATYYEECEPTVEDLEGMD